MFELTLALVVDEIRTLQECLQEFATLEMGIDIEENTVKLYADRLTRLSIERDVILNMKHKIESGEWH